MSCYHGMRRGYPSLCRTGVGTNARGLRSWPGSQGMRGLTDLRSNAVDRWSVQAIPARNLRARSESGELYLLHEDRETQSGNGCQT
jgi:hypothetical protein